MIEEAVKTRKTIKIPLELKPNFLRDPENFMRDIAAVPTEAIRPFIRRRDILIDLINESKKRHNPYNNDLRQFDDDFICDKDDLFNRYMHIDLGINRDAVGMSMCHAPYFVDRDMISLDERKAINLSTRLPFIKFDFLARIKAGKREDIILESIRRLIYDLTSRGFYISLITFDGFQSVDMLQILRKRGYRAARLSIDRTSSKVMVVKYKIGKKDNKNNNGIKIMPTEGQIMSAVESLKMSMYEERLSLPYHKFFGIEAKGAEINYKKNKVDHKPRGTIDLFQSVAGSTFNLVNNEIELIDDSVDYSTKEDDFDVGPESDYDNYYPEEQGESNKLDRGWSNIL